LLCEASAPWRSALRPGAALGLCALTRATILACLPVIAWWLWGGWRSAGSALALARRAARWWWRPGWRATSPSTTASSSPAAARRWCSGWATTRTPSRAPPPRRRHPRLYDLLPESASACSGLDELGQQDLFRARGQRLCARAAAGLRLRRWALKLRYFWWQSPQAGQLYPAAGFRLYQAFYLLQHGAW
jgi:hypothetical protein